MRKVRRIRRTGQGTQVIKERLAAVPLEARAINAKVALIQELILLHHHFRLNRKQRHQCHQRNE